MRLVRYIFFTSIFLLCPPLLASQLDQEILKIEQAYNKIQSLQVEFVQNTEVAILDKVVRRSGRLYYARPAKLRIEYVGEKMTHYILNKEKLSIWHPKTKQLQEYNSLSMGLPQEALTFLTGLSKLSESYEIKNAKNGFLRLKPKKKTTYKYLEGKFGTEGYLDELILHTLSGNRSHYRFFNRKVNKPIAKELFLSN